MEQGHFVVIELPGGARCYQFQHVMLKESAYNLLPFETRMRLHGRVAHFFEERQDYLERWYGVIANHYYIAKEWERAVHYLDLAGNEAMQIHGMQQVWKCYHRLLKIDANAPWLGITVVRKAMWCRKVGEALMHLNKADEAQEFLFRALEAAGFGLPQSG